MVSEGVERRLTTIVSMDVAGYSRLMEADEAGTLAQLKAHRKVTDSKIGDYGGRIVGTAGDGLLVEFPSVSDAVACALEVQALMAERNADLPAERRMEFRIGVNLGDVMIEGDDIFGTGVNIAARLQVLAEPGGICVSQPVRDQVRHSLGLTCDDLGDQMMKNIAEPVRAFRVRLDGMKPGTAPAAARAIPALELPDKPSIAVLPFDNMSGDPEQEYFSDGITEDIITALSKNRWLSVIARNSTFRYKGKSPDVRLVGKDLGVNYVLEGSVRKAGNRVRISAQLIDAGSGNHIWAERYDRDLEDIFAVQDEITETIAARIEPELAAVEGLRVQRKHPQNFSAWDCYHLGLLELYHFSSEHNEEAQRLFRQAIEHDPTFAAAYARLAYSMVLSVVYFDAEPTQEHLDEALHIAQRAAAFDDKDAVSHFALGRVHLVRCEYDLAIVEMQTAIELNSSLAQAYCALGDSLAYKGQPEDSISQFEEAIRLSPQDPHRWAFMMYRSLAHLFLRQHEAAAEWAGKAVRIPNSAYWANAHLVSALGHLDRPDPTRSAVADLYRRKPKFSCGFARKHLFYIQNPDQMSHYVDGLRKAGIPE